VNSVGRQMTREPSMLGARGVSTWGLKKPPGPYMLSLYSSAVTLLAPGCSRVRTS
jgi:hypothetical protein